MKKDKDKDKEKNSNKKKRRKEKRKEKIREKRKEVPKVSLPLANFISKISLRLDIAFPHKTHF